MFNKFEFIGGITVALVAGIVVGYSKAREKFVEAIAIAQIEYNIKQETKESK